MMSASLAWIPGRTLMVCALASCSMAGAQNPPVAQERPGYVLPDGTIRIVGAASMKGVIERLDALYVEKHPGVRFRYEASDNNGAIDALIFDATPFAPIGTIYGGSIAYSDIVKAAPFSVRIAHGSLRAQAKVSPLAVIVNPANSVGKLSMTDVASMFSKPARARVYAEWGQAGVKMAEGSRRIEPAGLPWSDHYASEDRAFGDDVFFRHFGGAAPVDSYRMFKTYAEVVEFVAREPGAVGIVAINQVTTAVKMAGIVDGPFGTAREATADGIRSGRYPLDRYLYLHARVQAGKPMDALTAEYLRLALSPEGQAAIANEGEGYLPLNSVEVADENGKLN